MVDPLGCGEGGRLRENLRQTLRQSLREASILLGIGGLGSGELRQTLRQTLGEASVMLGVMGLGSRELRVYTLIKVKGWGILSEIHFKAIFEYNYCTSKTKVEIRLKAIKAVKAIKQ